MARPRNPGNGEQRLPPNLYRDRNSFIYRNPLTGERRGCGTNEAIAIDAALKANAFFAEKQAAQRALLAPLDEMPISIQQLIAEFWPYKQTRSQSARTLKEARLKLNRYEREFGSLMIDQLTVRFLSQWLDTHIPGYDAWRKHRIQLAELIDFAIGKGYLPANHGNPARVLLKRTKPPKKRARLSMDDYAAIYAEAPDWLQIAMDLSLQTTLRLGDVIRLRFDDLRDGYLYVTPRKTQHSHEPIHLKIRVGSALDVVIKRARQSGVISPFIVHYKPTRRLAELRSRKEHWTELDQTKVSHAFSRARKTSGVDARFAKGAAPTFHEIRALSSHLYKLNGRSLDSVQVLMGHSSQVMTEWYQAGHEVEYVETWADLPTTP